MERKLTFLMIAIAIITVLLCLYSSPLESYSRRGVSTITESIIENGGNAFYAIKRTNIDPNTSVNLAFGFTSRIVIIETPSGNGADLVVDWIGGTAVAPTANTAGDDLVSAGKTITLDNFHTTSISVIGSDPNTATLTVYVRAHR